MPRRGRRRRKYGGPGLPRGVRGRVRIRYGEGDSDAPGRTASNLNLVDIGSMSELGQFQVGPASLKQCHPAALGVEHSRFAKPEDIAIEGQRPVIVLGGHDEAHLGDKRAVGRRGDLQVGKGSLRGINPERRDAIPDAVRRCWPQRRQLWARWGTWSAVWADPIAGSNPSGLRYDCADGQAATELAVDRP